MAAAQDGDREAYEKLLRDVLPRLRAFVRGRLGDPSSVEDVVQNVLLSLHQARHTYRPERSFAPWFWTIARNAVTDAQRARTTRARREEAMGERDFAADAPEPDPSRRPLSPELANALESLPEAQREAVELLHVKQLSVAEAAERVGVSPGALKVRAHRGYKALRARLSGRSQ
jgi:RNA polymerase sigma-70 factor (ECF subfamily)